MKNTKTYFGIDWGSIHEATCVSVVDADGQQQHLELLKADMWPDIRQRLLELYDNYLPLVILGEHNGLGGVRIDELQDIGLPARPFSVTVRSKRDLVDNLKKGLAEGRIQLLQSEKLAQDLAAYKLVETALGYTTYSADDNLTNDTVMATALSFWASTHFGTPISFA